MEPKMNLQYLFTVQEVELIYRAKVKHSERPKIDSSRATYELLMSLWDRKKIDLLEEFNLLMLNQAGKVLGIYQVSAGGITSTIVDVRLIFAAALKAMAVSIIIAHNHPSGNIYPSRADEMLTQQVNEGGKILEIKLLDHLIITSEGYYSFADEGRL